MIESYDVNFCFPVLQLENDKLRLSPFEPAVHAKPWFEASREHRELYDYVPFGPFDTAEDFINVVIRNRVQSDPGNVLFVVLDKVRTRPDSEDLPIAGIIGLLDTSNIYLTSEIGFVFTLPSYQRTHVTSNAIGLLLHWCLEPPKLGGLGLGRVQWQCNELNAASRRAAERMAFKFEAIERWQRVLPIGKQGPMVRREDAKKDHPGRHSVKLSLCWDEWDEAKEIVRKQTSRI